MNVYFQDFFNAQSVNSVLSLMKRKRHVVNVHTFIQKSISRRCCGTVLSNIFFVLHIISLFLVFAKAHQNLLWSTINVLILIDTISIGTW